MNINMDRLVLEARRSSGSLLLVVGILIAGAAVTLAMFSHLSYQRPWDKYRTVKAAFVDVKGSTVGHEPVRISGVNVGVVRKWQVDGDKAVLTLSIRKKYGKIYRNARARLRPVTPLDDMYVDLDRGTPAAGALPADGVIPTTQTVTPVDISRVMDVFDADSRQRLSTLIDELGAGTEDRGRSLRAAFVSLQPFLLAARDLTTTLADRRVELKRFVHEFGGVTHALAVRDRQLAGLVTDGDTTLGELARSDGALSATLAALPGTVGALRSGLSAVSTAEDSLDPALRDLRPVAASLDPALKALEGFSTDARPALAALAPAVGDLVPLSAALRPTVGRASTAVQRFRPQMPQLDRVTQMVTRCEDTISKFFQWTPSVLKFGDAHGANPRAEASVGLDTPPTDLPDPSIKRQPKCTDGFSQEDGG